MVKDNITTARNELMREENHRFLAADTVEKIHIAHNFLCTLDTYMDPNAPWQKVNPLNEKIEDLITGYNKWQSDKNDSSHVVNPILAANESAIKHQEIFDDRNRVVIVMLLSDIRLFFGMYRELTIKGVFRAS